MHGFFWRMIMSTPKPDTKLSKKEVETLNALQAVSESAQAIVADLDTWLNAQGEGKPNSQLASGIFWKYLKPETQKEFLTLIKKSLPKSIWNKKTLETFNIDDFMKDPNGGQSETFKAALVTLKNTNNQALAQLQKENKSLHDDKPLQNAISFVHLFSETCTQLMHTAHHILEIKEDQESGKATQALDNRDQICINALTALRNENQEPLGTDTSLLDSEPLFNILGEVISRYAYWKKKIEDDKTKTTDQMSQADIDEAIQDRQGKIVQEIEKELATLCMKYPKDTKLLDMAYRLQKEVLAKLEPEVTSTPITALPEKKLSEKPGIDVDIKRQIELLEDFKNSQWVISSENKEFIDDIIKDYNQCIARYQALSRNPSHNYFRHKILQEINKKYIKSTSKLNAQSTKLGIAAIKSEPPETLEKLKIREDETKEPFEGYTRVQEKVEGGKQEKAEYTGYYISNKTGEIFFIKQSLKHPDDDVAEIGTGFLLGCIIGQKHVVEYFSVPDAKRPLNVYIASKVSPGFKTLKQKALPIIINETPMLNLRPLGADLRSDTNKDVVYTQLEHIEQKKGMALILAGSLFLRDLDPQYGNMLLGTEADTQEDIRKFDHGWGLASICEAQHSTVNLFGSGAGFTFSSEATHTGVGIPTNHFNDYPKIINSQAFVNALDKIVKSVDNTKEFNEYIDSMIQSIIDSYPQDPERRLRLLADHIHLNITGKTGDALVLHIKENLKTQLKKRADSIAVLKCMMQIKVDLNENPQNANTIAKHMIELQTIIQDKLKDPNISATQVIPPFDPSFKTLLANAVTAMSNLTIDPKENNEAHLKYVQSLVELKEKAKFLNQQSLMDTDKLIIIEALANHKIKSCIPNRIKNIIANTSSNGTVYQQYQSSQETNKLLEDFKDKFSTLLDEEAFKKIIAAKENQIKIAEAAVEMLQSNLPTVVPDQNNEAHLEYLNTLEELKKEIGTFKTLASDLNERAEFERIEKLAESAMEDCIKKRIENIKSVAYEISEDATPLERYQALQNSKKLLREFKVAVVKIHDNSSVLFKRKFDDIQVKQVIILESEIKKLKPAAIKALKNEDIEQALKLFDLVDQETKSNIKKTKKESSVEIENTIDNLKASKIARLYTGEVNVVLAVKIAPEMVAETLIMHLNALNLLRKDIKVAEDEIRKQRLKPNREKSTLHILEKYLTAIEDKKKEIIKAEINLLQKKLKPDSTQPIQDEDIEQAKELYKLIQLDKFEECNLLEDQIWVAQIHKYEHSTAIELELNKAIQLNQALSKIASNLKIDYDKIEKSNRSLSKNARDKDIDFFKAVIVSINKQSDDVYSAEKKIQILHGAILILKEKMISTKTTIGMNNFQTLLDNTKVELENSVSTDMFTKFDESENDVCKINFMHYLKTLQEKDPNSFKKHELTSKILETPSNTSLFAFPSFLRRNASRKANNAPKKKPEVN